MRKSLEQKIRELFCFQDAEVEEREHRLPGLRGMRAFEVNSHRNALYIENYSKITWIQPCVSENKTLIAIKLGRVQVALFIRGE